MSLMFDPQLTLAAMAGIAAWLGLGWLTGRFRGLVRAGCQLGLADIGIGIGIGLASGRLPLAAGGVVILATWLFVGRRSS